MTAATAIHRAHQDDIERFKLLPREKLYRAVPAVYRGHRGNVFVTEQRVSWQRSGLTEAQLNIPLERILKQRTSKKRPKLGILVRDMDTAELAFNSQEEMRQLTEFIEKLRAAPSLMAEVPIAEGAVSTDDGETWDPERTESKAREELAKRQQELVKQRITAMGKLLDENQLLKDMFADLKKAELLPPKNASQFFKPMEEDLGFSVGNESEELAPSKQALGVPSGVWVQVKSQERADGLKTMRMTPEIADHLFKLYPTLQAKFAELVKTPKDEATFWTRVLSSHVFNRGSSTLKTGLDSNDILLELDLARQTAEEERRFKQSLENPLLDLTADRDNIVDGLGSNAPDEKVELTDHRKRQQRMFESFNADSSRLLDLMEPKRAKTSNLSTLASGTGEAGTANLQRATEAKRKRLGSHLRDLLVLEDLESEAPAAGTKLTLQKRPGGAEAERDETELAELIVPALLPGFTLGLPRPPAITDEMAMEALQSMWATALRDNPAPMAVPAEVGRVVVQYEQAFASLLHHFWRCFDPSRRDRGDKLSPAEKIHRFGRQLVKYQAEKLQQLLQQLDPQYTFLFDSLVQRVDKAVACYEDWARSGSAAVAATPAPIVVDD